MKRHLFKLGLLVLGGAIVNVTVLAAIALSNRQPAVKVWLPEATPLHGGTFSQSDHWLEYWGDSTFGLTALYWSTGLKGDKQLNDARKARTGLRAPPVWSGVPRRRSYQQPAADERPTRSCWHEVGIGWPTIAASVHAPHPKWMEIDCRSTILGIVRNDMRISWHRATESITAHLWWPGLAINTLFYAAILGLLWFGPASVRQMIRRRRGLCPVCAYPIGTSPVCTECGTRLITEAA